jgi:hypothetical protein
MRRRGRPPVLDRRQPWQIAQGNACGCRGSDDLCACQNFDQSDPAQRRPTREDLEQRIRELEGTIRSLELQQATDRQTIASLTRSPIGASPAGVSDEVPGTPSIPTNQGGEPT